MDLSRYELYTNVSSTKWQMEIYGVLYQKTLAGKKKITLGYEEGKWAKMCPKNGELIQDARVIKMWCSKYSK